MFGKAPGLEDEDLPRETIAIVLRREASETAGFGKSHWLTNNGSTPGFEIRYRATDAKRRAVRMSQDEADALRRTDSEGEPYRDAEEYPQATSAKRVNYLRSSIAIADRQKVSTVLGFRLG